MARTIRRTRRTLTAGRWFLIAGLVFYSLMTTTPFVARHSEWEWSGPALGLIVDAAFIMALSAESTLANYGIRNLGRWAAAFRWFTGLSSVFLNTWTSIESRDPVGVAVHVIAPALVMLLAEVGPVYMAALADAERGVQQTHTFATPADDDIEHPVPGGVLTLPETLSEDDVTEVKTRWQGYYGNAAEKTARMQMDHPLRTAERLSKPEADKIIEDGWRHKLTVKEVAAAATRHPATVSRRFKQLDAELSV